MKCLLRLKLLRLETIVFSIFLSFMALYPALTAYSQSPITLNLETPGKLKNKLKGNDLSLIKSLTLKGTMNEKDFKYLNNLVNLESLNIEEVSTDLQSFATLPKLKELYLPTDKLPSSEFKDMLSASVNLELLSCCGSEKGSSTYPNLPNLKKVILKNMIAPDYITENGVDQIIDTLVIYNAPSSGQFRFREFQFRCLKYINKEGVEIYKLDSCKKEDDLKEINHMLGTWDGGSLQKLHIPNDLITIGEKTFAEADIKEIYTDDTDRPLFINESAFENCKNLKKLHFKRPVRLMSQSFANCKIDTLIFEKDVILETYALDEFKYLEFKKLPESLSDEFAYFLKYNDNIDYKVIVPEGAYESFVEQYASDRFGSSNKLKKSNVMEALNESSLLEYKISLTSPGTILSQLPINKLKQIGSLTISGTLNEADIQALHKCRNLYYLDISRCNVISASESQCHIPYQAFMNMSHLRKIVLPFSLKHIFNEAFCNCISLKEVKFSRNISTIGERAFYNTKIESLELPSPSIRIGDGAFANCLSLKSVDLSLPSYMNDDFKMTIFNTTPKLQVLKLPNDIKTLKAPAGTYDANKNPDKNLTIYFGKNIKSISFYIHNCKLYFKDLKAPTLQNCLVLGSGNQIYVPKGSLTSYFTMFGGDDPMTQFNWMKDFKGANTYIEH